MEFVRERIDSIVNDEDTIAFDFMPCGSLDENVIMIPVDARGGRSGRVSVIAPSGSRASGTSPQLLQLGHARGSRTSETAMVAVVISYCHPCLLCPVLVPRARFSSCTTS